MFAAATKVIGLFVRADLSIKRDLMRSLAQEAHARGNWELLLLAPVNRGVGFKVPPNLDGLIVWPDEPEEVEILLKPALPTVSLGQAELSTEVARIKFDNHRMGRMIAEGFLECGFRHFGAYCQRLNYQYAQDRLAGFQKRIEEAGLEAPHLWDGESMSLEPAKWQEGLADLSDWIDVLPKPLGILCDTDQAGSDLLRACQHLGIPVPDTLAVIAVGNDDLLCNLSHPSLSSVALPAREIARLAAGMLEKRMRFPRRKALTLTMDQFSIVTRASSDFMAVKDTAVIMALRTIRERATLGVSVEDVARVVALSRRALEVRFKFATGRTVYDEILRIKLKKAQSLLSATELSVAEVADRSGFSEPQRLCELFARKLSVTPMEWRRRSR